MLILHRPRRIAKPVRPAARAHDMVCTTKWLEPILWIEVWTIGSI